MGLFISNCPTCNAEIYWFLKVPKNYHCKECGKLVYEHEIEESHKKNYAKHLGISEGRNRAERRKNKNG